MKLVLFAFLMVALVAGVPVPQEDESVIDDTKKTPAVADVTTLPPDQASLEGGEVGEDIEATLTKTFQSVSSIEDESPDSQEDNEE
ncbi:hypothetical protein Pcinc_004170 [Petrolisthes cinctipes]|uniref:Secreted protein n=1 Tax=Petrolisthes cinctipes TaxID=88211 RepID=A0AAE1L3Y3_PETCI|nr:hypothetical protein Pcinc_004170 [Petrolisthes cinctipes]